MIPQPSIRPDKPRICVPVCAARIDELVTGVERAARVAEVIEIRLDCLEQDELQRLTHNGGATLDNLLQNFLRDFPHDFILTLRPAEEGGRGDVSRADRILFWNSVARSLREDVAARVSCDIELSLLEQTDECGTLDTSIDRRRIICSHHDFDCVPADLDRIYERAVKTNAGVIKIAVAARDVVDCVEVFKLIERARGEGRGMIGVAMNTPGLLTRVLAPAHGARLTFAALDERSATAPGQLAAAELRDLYRVHAINPRMMLTGLIGAPISHSLSPQMHNRAFAARARAAVYVPLEVHDLAAFVRRMVRGETREMDFNWRGFSITAPHKEAIIPHLDGMDDAARAIGAVNTIVVEDDKLLGYNTDAAAVLAPVEPLLELRGARVAVIGAGGAARAALWSLRERGARTVVFARDTERARAVCTQFNAACLALDAARFDSFDLVINTTPLGTLSAHGAHEDQTPTRAESLRGARIVYDLVYNPSSTRFMREGEAAGCRSVGGLEMLVNQAASQWKLWTGEDAPVDVMRDAAEEKLKAVNDPAST